MANVLTVPASGAIIFDNQTAGSSTISPLSSAPRLQYDNAGGLNITSYTTGTSALDRFTVDGSTGRLFSISDALTGIIFSVNDISGLPLIEVNSGIDDTITLGAYPTNALVVRNDKVSIGTATPNEKLTVVGNISATGNGRLFLDAGTNSARAINFGTVSMFSRTANIMSFFISNTNILEIFSGQLRTGTQTISFTPTSNAGVAADCFISRTGVGSFAFGTTAGGRDGSLNLTNLSAFGVVTSNNFTVLDNIVTQADDFTLSGTDAGKYIRLTKPTGTQTIALTGLGILTGHEFTFYRATSAALALSGGTVNGGSNISSVPQFGAFALKHLGGGTFDFI